MTKKKRCVDCEAEGVSTRRKIVPGSGGRCATHHRIKKKERTAGRHADHIGKTYGITAEEYAAIMEHQGGRCAICQRATGASRRLAVDHDHTTGLVRGCLCRTCNRYVLGHLRDDTTALQRAIDYLNDPPAFAVIGKRRVPEGGAPVKGNME